MTIEKVIWTVLPNGLTTDRLLQVSVHVAPRLSNADLSDRLRTLGEFPAFARWPERLEHLGFRLEFTGGVVAEGKWASNLDPELWMRLFPPETVVKPFAFKDHARRNLHVFPVRKLLRFLERTYGALGAVGTDLPSIDDAAGPLAPFTPLKDITNRITDSTSFKEDMYRFHQRKEGDGQVVSEDIADHGLPFDQQEAQNSVFQAYRFYYRPGSQRQDLPEKYIEPGPVIPEFDFHQMVAQIADHPALMRMLGLVFDLVVDLPDPQAHLPSVGVVRLVPDGDLPENPPTCPGTRYELDEAWFGARPADHFRLSRGLLRLNPELYDFFQVDVDGSALKVADFANSLDRLLDANKRGPATPSEVGAPALRSAGFGLARYERGPMLLGDLRDRRDKNAWIEAGSPVEFDAEDLVRGYRLDVFDENAPDGPRWFSLHKRASRHQIADPAGVQPDWIEDVNDEGYLKATSASGERADHPEASDDLYLHETVAGWEGWSLSAPRPGKRIVEPGEGDGGSHIGRFDPELDNPFPIVTQTSVEPRSLPRLRLGHRYRLRARTVDLAGNSRAFSEEDYKSVEADSMTETQPYLRFEPVPSPVILRKQIDTEGESLEHLVIRSNLGQSAEEYSNSPEVQEDLAEAGALHEYTGDSQRHLAPPKTSQQMAEQDGCFDAAFGGSEAQMTEALRIALREEGTFLDLNIVDTLTGQKTISQSKIELFPPGAQMPAKRGDGLADGAYAYYSDDSVLLPYLPDPLAIGVSLSGYDYGRQEVFHQIALFSDGWPALQPFRLRLSEGPLGVEFTNGILEVRLPQAEVVRARLASVLPDGRLEDMAIWQWIPDPDKTSALEIAALAGRHWMITPFRWVTFTHAVQMPLLAPDMTHVWPTRALGKTYTGFSGYILNHAKSTGRLDVYAQWTEDIDLPGKDPQMRTLGTEVDHQAYAFGFDINPDEDKAWVSRSRPSERISRHEFGDTKHRRVIYYSVATTRFREYFPPAIANNPARIQRIETTTDQDGNLIPALVHHVPSSARPAAPDVLYTLPTFRWERHDKGNYHKHIRHGKALRVWMNRPWFSSGDDEQLAVVLEPGVKLPKGWRMSDDLLGYSIESLSYQPPTVRFHALGKDPGVSRPESNSPLDAGLTHFGEITSGHNVAGLQPEKLIRLDPQEVRKMLRPYVSSWGGDPVWKSGTTDQPPTVAAFPRQVGYAAGLTLDELPSSIKVVVAAHEVFFDHQRNLWYCDIEIDPGDAYFPFVRLALARYQPYSVENAHLSPVTMTDFIQLPPDRTSEVVIDKGTANITVQGFAGRNIIADLSNYPFHLRDVLHLDEDSPNTSMRVALERRIPDIPGDLGWERVGDEITLHPENKNFYINWEGSLELPDQDLEPVGWRLVVTEVETYLRDLMPGDPGISTSPVDFLRERVVFADIFEI